MVLCTCPDTATAERLAEMVVGKRLAACVNIVPGITSVYSWQDTIEKEAEVLLMIKTTKARWEALQSTLVAAHPYEVPEVVAAPLTHGTTPYFAWLRKAVAEDPSCAG